MAKARQKELKQSSSGIRGVVGNGLDPVLVTRYAAAFGRLVGKGTVVVGRDTRLSGRMFRDAVVAGLNAVGVDVVDIGIVPTPTVEIAVKGLRASGGICVTASHNAARWNALKFFNDRGEFVTPAQYKRLDAIFQKDAYAFKPYDRLGSVSFDGRWVENHIREVLKQRVVRRRRIRSARFRVVVDAINGAGSAALPELLERLGARVFRINCNADGDFVHEPEPVPENVSQLGRAVRKHKAHLGMACDPDADRLSLVDEKGRPIGEELTLAIAVRHVLEKTPGPTVINLSTSSVTADAARAAGSRVYYSRVGESNVVDLMRRKKAIIGGEGNGGVIYPGFHAGRDSLIAAALVLSALASASDSLSSLVETFGRYYTKKAKGDMPSDFDKRLARFEKGAPKLLGQAKVDRRDGLRFDFDEGWLQIRGSNTEPIFRLVVETRSERLTARLSRAAMKYFKK
jgi:phosphomannomutase